MNQPPLVDSHCHLPLIELDARTGDLDTVVAAAGDLGVAHMLCVCIDLEGFPQIQALASRYPGVFASVGVHPNSAVENEPTVEQLVSLAGASGVVAIGESGLDYFRSSGDLDWQRQRFRVHIRAARQAQLPLVVHTREAKQDVIRLLREEGADASGGVMHCFVEDWDTARAALDLGFYISFSGIVTFKSATEVQDVAKRIPDDRLLVETDSPYLAPVPYRGKQNQPAYVTYVAEFLAGLRGVSKQRLCERTTENFFTLFQSAARSVN